MDTITVHVYSFDELTKGAKAYALAECYRDTGREGAEAEAFMRRTRCRFIESGALYDSENFDDYAEDDDTAEETAPDPTARWIDDARIAFASNMSYEELVHWQEGIMNMWLQGSLQGYGAEDLLDYAGISEEDARRGPREYQRRAAIRDAIVGAFEFDEDDLSPSQWGAYVDAAVEAVVNLNK